MKTYSKKRAYFSSSFRSGLSKVAIIMANTNWTAARKMNGLAHLAFLQKNAKMHRQKVKIIDIHAIG
jgi:hypothetical protein